MTQIPPTAPKQRIAILDSLRGFAIFGILLVNITAFSLPNQDYQFLNLDNAKHWYDYLALAIFLLADGKFYILFSFLFGIGFSVQFNSVAQKGGNILSFYPRRLMILFLLGLVHSFFWWGDILRIYAILGFILLFLRNWSIKSLSILAIFSLILSVIIPQITQLFWGEQMPNRDDVLLSLPMVFSEQGATAFALFLLGRIVGKLSFFEQLSSHQHLLKKWLKWVLIGGMILLGVAYLLPNQIDWLAGLIKTVGDILLTTAMVSLLCLLSLKSTWQTPLKALANVGKLALSNYILQTMICVAFFDIFALSGQLSLGILLLMAIVIYALQLVMSHFWLKYFNYGLLEWAWRCLTYGKWQTLKK